MTTIQVLSGIYLGISFLNILVASIQYYNDKNSVQKTIILYWLGSTISAIMHGFFPDNDMKLATVSMFGTFVSTYFLGSFFAQLHDVKISLKKMFGFFTIGYLITFVLSRTGINFSWYAFPGLVGCVAPLPVHLIAVYRKNVKLTITQKIFFITAIVMSLHFLDWSFFKERPELFMPGFLIATVILFMLSILTPMLANEYSLMKRNNQLEDEINKKVKQLTQIESKLWEANKLGSLGRMAGGVAHEMNTPLTAIRLTAESIASTLVSGNPNIEKSHAWAKKITVIVDRLSEITSKLRVYGNNIQTEAFADIFMSEVVELAVSPIKNKIDEKNINLSIELNDQNTQFKGQKTSLAEALTHLINNSIKANEFQEKPWIRIETKVVEQFLYIYIKDGGEGVPVEIRSKIFDPFFTTHDIGAGTGLGLSVSLGIVNQHHGEIILQSSKPESSETCFLVKIPIERLA